MKVIIEDQRRYIIRFDKGEEVLEGLRQFMKQEAVNACAFSAIGACNEIEIAFYNEHLKEYRNKPFWENYEILSLTGNGSIMDGQPVIHTHGIFGLNDFSTVGGHVNKVVVSVTCEVFLIKLEGKMERKLDAETNLKLLQ